MWFRWLCRKLPTDARELEGVAVNLGVSLFGTGTTHPDTNEMQRRIMDHIRFRKDGALWLIAILSALSSLVSALAAWFAVLPR